MRRGLGLALACLLAVAGLALHQRQVTDPHVRWDRFELPAFDAYVYVAMADAPAFFTVAPWGYRVLTPYVASVLPVGNTAKGLRYVTWGALATAGVLLFGYLRARGHAAWAALLGVAAFIASGPVNEVLRYRFLAEPLTVALEIGFLLALELGAGAGVLGLVAGLGALSKEFFLLLLPLVFLARLRDGWRRAVVTTLLVSAPAVAFTVVLRWFWVPHIDAPAVGFDPQAFVVAAQRVVATWREWAPSLALFGLAPLAVLGSLRAKARSRLAGDAYLVFVVLVPPFFNPVTFFAGDIPRLLLYALPAAIPLALVALDRLVPHVVPTEARGPWPRIADSLGFVGSLVALAGLFASLDRYHRLDLQGPRDGPYVLSFSRETRRTAARLDRGLEVSFDPAAQRFDWGVSRPGEMARMRWFLRDGWGDQAHYGTGPIVMRGTRAGLVIPCFVPRDMDVVLTLAAPEALRLTTALNGHDVGTLEIGPAAEPRAVRLPAELLFRGDNSLVLSTGQPGPTLLGLALHPVPARDAKREVEKAGP